MDNDLERLAVIARTQAAISANMSKGDAQAAPAPEDPNLKHIEAKLKAARGAQATISKSMKERP